MAGSSTTIASSVPFSHLCWGLFLWSRALLCSLVLVRGDALLLLHHVDLGRFSHLGHRKIEYTGHTSLLNHLGQFLKGGQRIAMEYSPIDALPGASQVDGGTPEMVRSVGVDMVSSADLVQYAT